MMKLYMQVAFFAFYFSAQVNAVAQDLIIDSKVTSSKIDVDNEGGDFARDVMNHRRLITECQECCGPWCNWGDACGCTINCMSCRRKLMHLSETEASNADHSSKVLTSLVDVTKNEDKKDGNDTTQVKTRHFKTVLAFNGESSDDLEKKELSQEEKEFFQYAWKTASHIVNYGPNHGVKYPKFEDVTIDAQAESPQKFEYSSATDLHYWEVELSAEAFCSICKDRSIESVGRHSLRSIEGTIHVNDTNDSLGNGKLLRGREVNKRDTVLESDSSQNQGTGEHSKHEIVFCNMLLEGPIEKFSKNLQDCFIMPIAIEFEL